MNIVQAEKYYWIKGGAPKYALELSRALQERDHTVIPFATLNKQNLSTPHSRFFVHSFDDQPEPLSLAHKMQFARNIFYSSEAKRNMSRLLDAFPVDLVHLHTIYHQISPSILPVIKKRNIPIVMTVQDYKLISPNYLLFHDGHVHEEDARGWYLSCIKNKCFKNSGAASALVTAEMIFHHKIKKYYERLVDCFIAPSAFMREKLIEHGYDATKIIQLPLGTFFSDQKMPTAGEYVAYVGRLSEEKGVDVLLKAAERLPNIPLVIIGDGPERPKLQAFVNEKKLKNVTFLGYQNDQELEKAIAGARLVVVPSLWYENCPLSVIESMAAGKVVLGSRIGGLPEMVPAALLFTSGDVTGLATLITTWFTKSDTEIMEQGKMLALHAREKYNLSEQVIQIEKLYQGLIDRYASLRRR